MITITSVDDLALLRETVELECKLAAGRDGQGVVPDEFWPTYSAFANTRGGTIILGVREKAGRFTVEGLGNPAKVRKDLFDTLNNRQKVSVNVLTDALVREMTVDGRVLLVIDVPRATRQQRPVFLNGNPFNGNTYLREIAADHPVELSRRLRTLIDLGMLESLGGPRAVYHLAGSSLPTPEDVFGPVPISVGSSPQHVGPTSQHLEPTSQHLTDGPHRISIDEATASQERRNIEGCLLSPRLDVPIIDDIDHLSVAVRRQLEAIAAEPRSKAKLDRERMIDVILKLCQEHYVTLRCLATLVNRDAESLRNHYLTSLVKNRRLALAFPKTPSHERQAYRTAPTDEP